jgi:uncharacterized protein
MIKKLKHDLLQHRKNKETNKALILSTLIGEIETLQSRDKSKSLTDGDIIKMIDKTIINTKERLQYRADEQGELEVLLLSSYLPKRLTEEEIKKIKIDNGFTSAKELMPFLKANYDGLYDGKLASKIANET